MTSVFSCNMFSVVIILVLSVVGLSVSVVARQEVKLRQGK